MSNEQLFTIGHSNHSIERFSALLEEVHITAVADVRSSPYSRMNPQFNRESLEKTLKEQGIRYVFLGDELGGRIADRACYEEGRVKYERVAKTDSFQSALARVRKGAQSFRLALLCAEKEPLRCHRTLLVARALEAQGVSVFHILPDGRLESHAESMNRLLDLLGLGQPELYRTKDDLIDLACAIQEERVAFTPEEVLEATAERGR
jgi:uncharacterized protein (DUF488 family)